jgi:outer membrane lipoprotein carrier protein
MIRTMNFRPLIASALAATLAASLASPDVRAEAAAPAKASQAPEESADAIAARVQAFYDQTKTFRAEFQQRYTIKAYNRTKDSRGNVIFAKPGKMSWRYTTNGNRVVSDGKLLRVYEEENKQMYEQAVEKSQYPAALAFLVGDGNLQKSFKLRRLDEKRAKFEGGYVLLGEPKEPTPAYQKMLLYIDKGTAQVRRVMLIDAQGNRNRFDFAKPTVNQKTQTGEFDFRPPPGTKVIRP